MTSVPHDQLEADKHIIPGLPNDVAELCLARVARSSLHALRLVSKQWKEVLSREDIPGHRASMGVQERWLCVETRSRGTGCMKWKAFDIAYGVWRQLAPVPPQSANIMGRASGVVGGHLVVAGGEVYCGRRGVAGGIIGDVFAYSPLTNQWHSRASMKQPCAHAVFGVVGGELYVLGGLDCSQEVGQCYNFERDEWRQVGNEGFHMTEHQGFRSWKWIGSSMCYAPAWRTFNVCGKSISCSSRRETGQVFSYDEGTGRWKDGGPLSGTHDGTRAAYFASLNLRCMLINYHEKSSWEVGKVVPQPSLAHKDRHCLGGNIPSATHIWTDISSFQLMNCEPGALVLDGHRVYVLMSGLKLGVFEIEQHGTRCTMISFNDQQQQQPEEDVMSCQLLGL